MAELVNLRQARKQKARAAKEKKAAANRAKFGRGKVEKLKDRVAASKAEKDLDGKKRET
ncbi:DUF4169 family protein [Magnetospira sp. QH-2]|uniref:DUF4169 family protein n=1 Tax=Magnetospira sp. (strain QH-2) TaxID=1288970 RepID=UPI0003E812ED|nr:DUF4169 family protein [Magnetospira sp. QH-2]CCQ73565.1 Conserved protein of unknown function [Magnetospira sp. QH-2]